MCVKCDIFCFEGFSSITLAADDTCAKITNCACLCPDGNKARIYEKSRENIICVVRLFFFSEIVL